MKGLFITGTDTAVGKTVASLVLGTLLQKQGLRVGYMKPVQCAGRDARRVRDGLGLTDPVGLVNPCYAPEPLSPHLAFARAGQEIDLGRIMDHFRELERKYDVVLVEGAGGLMVPLKSNYFVADLVREMGLDVVIVARPGLGTINHSLLTIEQARGRGLNVRAVIFSAPGKRAGGIPERTNPRSVGQFGEVPVLGTIPRLAPVNSRTILAGCKGKIDLKPLFRPQGTTRNAAVLAAWDKKYVWHPFTQMKDWMAEEPLVIDKGEGAYLIDARGNRYLDGVSSLWVNVHGHRKREIDAAVKRQVDKLGHSTMLGLSNTPAVELARELVGIAPKGLSKVFYSDNGSTAVEVALKMAYQYWQNTGHPKKTMIAHLANSYHGDTLGSVSVGGIGLFHHVYKKLIFKTLKIDFPDGCRAPKGKVYPDYFFECVDKMERTFRASHPRIAALVVEPLVQGAAGMIVWPKGVLRRMRDICARYDIIFIADEVATGFGRTGKMFACEHERVTPDILCLAKGITGGYLPLAATLTTRKIFDGFVFDYKEQKTFFHGHTYTGNPLACAAALANLSVFRKERTLARLQPRIKFLSDRLKLFYNLSSVGQVRQMGMMAGIELVRDRKTLEPFPWQDKVGVRVCRKARERGVILRPLGNVIVLMPPLSISRGELAELLDVTSWAVEQVAGRNTKE